jgi:transcriptional regulator with XRE-family HTH domain
MFLTPYRSEGKVPLMRNESLHRPRDVLAARVKAARKRRGFTQQQLADRLGAALGRPVDRVTISKLEQGGTRSNATVEEVWALALALNVAPVHLLVPLEDTAPLEIVPGLPVPARAARAIVRGEFPLTDDVFGWLAEQPRSEVESHMRRVITKGDALVYALTKEKVDERVADIVFELQEGDIEAWLEQLSTREEKEES